MYFGKVKGKIKVSKLRIKVGCEIFSSFFFFIDSIILFLYLLTITYGLIFPGALINA